MAGKTYIPNLLDKMRKLKETHSIIKVAIDNGYSFIENKSTSKYAFLELNDDKILVYYNTGGPENYLYTTCDNKTDTGDVYHFLSKKGITNTNIEAFNYLNDLEPGLIDIEQAKITKSRKANNNTKHYSALPCQPITFDNYLIKERAITYDVLTSAPFKNRVFSIFDRDNKTHTTIFPLFNDEGQAVGQNLRDVNKKKSIFGSDKHTGYWINNHQHNQPIAILENPTDAISHHQLSLLTTPNYFSINYVATFGTPSTHILKKFAQWIKAEKYPRFLLSGDNALSGVNFNIQFIFAAYNLINESNITADKSINIKDHDDKNYNYYDIKISNKETANKMFSDINDYKQQHRWEYPLSISNYQINDFYHITITVKKHHKSLHQLSLMLINIFELNTIDILTSTYEDFNDDLQQYYKTNNALTT